MSCQDILDAHARPAGIASHLVPFAAGATLKERFSANPYLMAPMAGVSDAAWRIMARAGGAALAYTEMVSVAGIHYAGAKTWELVLPDAAEPDIAVQLFGSKPEQFAEAAEAVCERVGEKLALIDINMACPVPKVTRKGEGSALLDEPELAAKIVRETCAHASVPVTVKIRRGRRMGEDVCEDFARALEAAGAQTIAVHGRYASQLYRGEADWGCVERVARAVAVPVIGSGDVLDAGRAARMRAETGAAAVMIARGSYGNPWIFSQARALDRGEEAFAPQVRDRLAAFRAHVLLLEETGAHLARARSLAGWYFKGMAGAASWRGRAMSCSTLGEFLELAAQIEAACEA